MSTNNDGTDYLHLNNNKYLNHTQGSYHLLNGLNHHELNSSKPIIISILYKPTDINHLQGKFYIGQVLHRLLKYNNSRIVITVCENNENYLDLSTEVKLIRRLLPVFIVRSSSDENTNIFEREKQAHLQCILANFETFPESQHLLLLQDDAEPISDNFLSQLTSLIDNRLTKLWPIDNTQTSPSFVKIYHPRWLIGYTNIDIYVITQLISTSLSLTFFIYFLFLIYEYRILRKRSYTEIFCFYLLESKPKKFKWLTNIDLIHILSSALQFSIQNTFFIYVFVSTTITLIFLNHTNTSWSWRSLHTSLYAIYPAPSCCLPGVIYFRQSYLPVVRYLARINCTKPFPIDTALDKLSSVENLRAYLIEPNLVRHIGFYSRLRHSYINPYLLD